MHHLPENLDALFQEWLNRNVDPRRLTHESARDLLKRGFQAGFELHEVTEGRKRAAIERQHADYPGGSADYAPRAYRNPSQPPFTATRDAYVPGTDGMPSYDTHFFPVPAYDRPIPGHEAAQGPETRQFPAVDAEIPPPPGRYHVGTTPWFTEPALAAMPRPDDGTSPGKSGPRAPMETRFDYIEAIWAENDQG